MRVRPSSIARGSLMAAVMAAILAACGGSGATTDQAGSRTPATAAASPPAATTPPATTSADPLEGDWRTEFTCQESVRAIQARLSEKQIFKQVGSWKAFLAPWGGEPTNDDPCRGATGTAEFVARFADANLSLCDAKTGGCGAHATYELVDDHSITLNDPEENLCSRASGTCRFHYDIAGGRLTFHVLPDVFVIGTWEAAPWTRES